MVKVKKGDFIEIEYVGRIKGGNQIFDLTDIELAKKNGLYNPELRYGPRIICVGEGDLIKGLDNSLIDKEIDKSYNIEVESKDAFGDRDNRLIRVVSNAVFVKEKINPFPGLQVNIDGIIGMIRSVSGGRVVVDFNHPLAGKDLIYDIKINRVIDDKNVKVKSILENKLGLMEKDYNIVLKDGKADVELKKDIDEELKKKVHEIVKQLVNIDISFIIGR